MSSWSFTEKLELICVGLTEYKSTRVVMFKTIGFCRLIILEAEYIQTYYEIMNFSIP